MSRSVPAPPPTAWNLPTPNSVTYHIKVVTPMFGDGFNPREVDELDPIRPSAIRGHLRFWWRATAGAAFDTPQALHDAESKLWGNTELPSSVAVHVCKVKCGSPKSYADIVRQHTAKDGPGLGYFLFPYREISNPIALDAEGMCFEMAVAGLEREGIRDAIEAWILLGGIGARTRRGCGALEITSNPSVTPSSPAKLLERLNRIARVRQEMQGLHYTILHGSRCVMGPEFPTAQAAWKELANFWARFRKGHFGTAGYSPYKGGRWGDYNTLKRNRQSSHVDIQLAKPFLGMPIIYQSFPDAPYAPTIEPEESGRFASPVLLRPVGMANGSYRPLAIVLNGPQPESIRVKDSTIPVKHLHPPQSSQVLDKLGVSTPLAAVIEAAKQVWGDAAETFVVEGR